MNEIDFEALAEAAGAEAWDIWRDSYGNLHINLDGVSLLPELKDFAELVAAFERGSRVLTNKEG